MGRPSLEWISFIIIEQDIILEFRGYMGNCYNHSAVHFLFHNKDEADKFVPPQWVKEGCIRETTGLPRFSERELAENGFPSP
jgi:hypothetical protein